VSGDSASSDHEQQALKVGQTWTHRRQSWRRVEITSLRDRADGDVDAYVRRNTSRRTQAIKRSTLLRDYWLATW
jgi:hypothetical protein